MLAGNYQQPHHTFFKSYIYREQNKRGKASIHSFIS